MPFQELAVVGPEIMDFGDGDEEIGTDIADLALHVALLVTSVRVAELHAAAVMRTEPLEQLGLMYLAADAPANTRGIVEDQERWDTADVLEDVPEALADTFCRLTAEYLREPVVAVGERDGQVLHAAADAVHLEIGFAEIHLGRAGLPDELLCRTRLLLVPDGLDIALDSAVRAVEAFFLAEPVQYPLGGVLLLRPDMLVFRQPLQDLRLVRIQLRRGRLLHGRRRREVLLAEIFPNRLAVDFQLLRNFCNSVSTIAQISDIIDLGHFEHILSSFILVGQNKG